jgi:Radical SAM superfamily
MPMDIKPPGNVGLWLSLLTEPRSREKMRLNRLKWDSLSPELRVPQQAAGKATPSCGATWGVMEKCDFACTSCYLSDLANDTRPLPFEDVKRQLDALRNALGPGGKVQLTSGEVTLLPVADLGRMVSYGRSIDLDVMVMTNGQRLVHHPDYLPTLVNTYGLEKIGIHVDGTQKGRKGHRAGSPEEDLHPVRDQFAALIKSVRAQTGRRLDAAQMVTVTEGIFPQIPTIVDWMLDNLDSFRMLSIQPVAEVGRTKDERPDGMTLDAVWAQVCKSTGRPLNRHAMYFGHPSCSIVAPWLVFSYGGGHHIVEASREGKRWDLRFFQQAMGHLGGFATVKSTRSQTAAKLLGVLARSPGLLLEAPVYGLYRLWGDRSILIPFLLHWLTGRPASVRPLVVVVHKFMNADELKTPLGRARLDACVFKLPVEGKMVSMCEMNATPIREALHREWAVPAPSATVPAPQWRRTSVDGAEVGRLASTGELDSQGSLEDRILGRNESSERP